MKETLAGRYQVGSLIGRGGMADVYRGLDTTLDRTVAIKVLSDRYAADPNFVVRFQHEAQAAARLNHPNVVNVYDVGADDDVHYIVMEYVQGRTLAQLLAQDGRLLPERAAEIAERICDALTFAHQQGIVHRDVKSANIMVTDTGDVKLMDFGIARGGSDETVAQTAAVLGTAAYFSPEQARGDVLDQRTDLYSLGVVLYEMLTGRVPFVADTAVAVAMAHVQEAPTPPAVLIPGIPASIDAVVMRALSKNPDNRYADAIEMKDDLERARLGQAVTAPPVAPTQAMAPTTPMVDQMPPTPGPQGSRWPLGLLIGGIVVAVLVVLFLLLNGGGSPSDDGTSTPTPTTTASPTVTVVKTPDVVGLTKAQARRELEGAGLVAAFDLRTVEDPAQVDVVQSQSPAQGTELDPGETVTVVIGAAPDTVAVPNLFGMNEADARQTLSDAGFTVGTVRERRSGSVDPGEVFEQDPPAATQVAPGSAVGFTVSSGREKVEVPDLTCQTVTRAQDTLESLGLEADLDTTPAPNLDCPHDNRVGAQEPSPGTLLEPGSAVTIQPSGP